MSRIQCLLLGCIFLCLFSTVSSGDWHWGWDYGWRCWSYRRVWRVYYTTERMCCYGWTGYNCNKPVCSPSCRNGGTCVAPNTCSCRSGYQGSICAGLVSCSHVKPCYPGNCHGSNQCACSEGFEGPSCLTLTKSDFKPRVERVNATFSHKSYTNNETSYYNMLDVTNTQEADISWTNQAKFNYLEFTLEAKLDEKSTFENIPSKPDYISSFKFGIVEAKIDVIHRKLKSSGPYEAKRQSLSCSSLSQSHPLADHLLKCDLEDNYIIQFDSGDNYTIRYHVKTGGYRDLQKSGGIHHRKEYYSGITAENDMTLRFDYDVPVHCMEDSSCTSGNQPLELEKDVTKTAISPKWSGWIDKLSGIDKYVFEIWKMEFSLDFQGLREPLITKTFNPKPVFIQEVNVTDHIQFPTYEPDEPGVYSAILEVVDRANNSRYARRFVIYDKTSKITLSDTNPLYATSTSNETGYSWKSKLDKMIQISWKNHFINTVHEEGHFLAKVLHYEPRLSDGIERHDYKKIDDTFDDTEGIRNKSVITNINGIVKFEKTHGRPSSQPPLGWINLVPLKETATFDITAIEIKDGDSHQFWVRASDIMGNTKVDSRVVHFDSTPPVVYPPKLTLNIHNGPYPFSSSVNVSAKDEDSGIRKVSFKFKVKGTNEVKNIQNFTVESKVGILFVESREQDFPKGKRTKEYCIQFPKDCYCVRMGDCFMIDTTLQINNCWLNVSIDNVNNDVFVLEVIMYNSAMLSKTEIIEIGRVEKLKGIKDYYSPSNITVIQTTDKSVKIKWVQAPTCYERASIVIFVWNPANKSLEFKVHKDATTFDLTGLSPVTNYRIEMFTKYGNETHYVRSTNPPTIAFLTAEEEQGLSFAGVGGISGGFLLLLLVVILVLVYLGRTGRLQPAKQQVTAGIRTIRNTVRRAPTGGINNRAKYSKEDDDIYMYGEMDMKGNQGVGISRKDISLESEIARGRFAIIYLAKQYGQREEKTVAAKTVINDQNAEDIMKMKAKINFYAKKVGHHKNILDFIGSVEDDVRGPMMILEYCSNGVLKKYLETKRSQATVDVDERLFRIAFAVCNGMDYLASKNIVHRRLAARNILLDRLLEPKITGFGPQPDKQHNDEQETEKLPIKWMAPECMKTTQYANELSDVWAYGIVLWEIFSLGDTPYPDKQSKDVPSAIRKGYKMKKPEYCDDAFYQIMLTCWHYDPRKRSGFAQIKEKLNKMFTEAPGDEYYYKM